MDDMIDKAFCKHQLWADPECKSWLIREPDAQQYWYKVTWTPGALHLMGDVGELTVIHYHAMHTWTEAVTWMDGNCFEYIMGKTNVKKELDIEKTVEFIVERANDELDSYSDDDLWVKIAAHVGWNFDPAKRDDLATYLESNGHELFQPHQLYELQWFDDYYGSQSYPDGEYWKYKALLQWAKLVRESEEYQSESKAA